MNLSGGWKAWPAIVAAGLFYILYLIYIVFLAFKITGPDLLTGVLISSKEIPFIIGASLLLIALFSTYANFFITQSVQNGSNKRIQAKEILFFIFYSLLLLLLMSFAMRIIGNKNFIFTKVLIVALLFFLSMFPLLQMGNFLIRLFLYNFFFNRVQPMTESESHAYRILEYADFQEHCLNTLNQCRRYKINLGLVALYLANIDEIECVYGQHGARFLRKQFIFIISENARSYEPWGRTIEKDVYINSLQIHSEEELARAELRFRELIDRHIFTIFGKDIKPDIRLRSRFIKTESIQNTPEDSDLSKIARIIDRTVTDIRVTE